MNPVIDNFPSKKLKVKNVKKQSEISGKILYFNHESIKID